MWIKGTATAFVYCFIAGFVCIWAMFRAEALTLAGILLSVAVALLLTVTTQLFARCSDPFCRRTSFLAAVGVRSLGYLVCIFVSVVGGAWITNIVFNGPTHASEELKAILRDPRVHLAILVGIPVLLVYNFVLSIARKLGPGVLGNWILGRYHRPMQEDRIFMFLDLRNSTSLAEQLGDMRFSAFIQDVFRDVTGPLIESGASVSHFIGDEVVITWPTKQGIEQGKCVRCFFSIADEFERLEAQYVGRYGVSPKFKAGMHCGTVISTEVGEIKSEIVFHGDVLNTSSRLQGLCNAEEADLLISGELAGVAPAPEGIEYAHLGKRELKGKTQPLEVVRVVRAPSVATTRKVPVPTYSAAE